MNTYTFGVSTTQPTVEHTYPTIDLFDQTNFIIDLSNVYCDLFPNYIAFNWGDGSSVEEPQLTICKDYRTSSIYSEVLKGPSPIFLNKDYSHIYYPSNIALNKSVTLRINIEYVTGAVTKLTVPVNIRTAGYHQTVEDMEVVGLDLLDNEMNSSRYTLLTKKDNYLLQVDNTAQKEEQYPDKKTTSKNPCPMNLNLTAVRLLLNSSYLNSIGFFAPKFMQKIKAMLKQCSARPHFLSDEERRRHIEQSPNWKHVPIPDDLLRSKPNFMSDEEWRRHIEQSPNWKHVPIPPDLLRYPETGPRGPDPGPFWTPEKQFQRPGDVDIRPDMPGLQIPFDEYMRRRIPNNKKAKRQRELKEALEEAQKGPVERIIENIKVYWWLFMSDDKEAKEARDVLGVGD